MQHRPDTDITIPKLIYIVLHPLVVALQFAQMRARALTHSHIYDYSFRYVTYTMLFIRCLCSFLYYLKMVIGDDLYSLLPHVAGDIQLHHCLYDVDTLTFMN